MNTCFTTIFDMLQGHASANPDAPALVIPGGGVLCFRDLAALAENALAFLNSRGLGRGDRVALLIDDRPTFAAANLALCGALTIIPLNPALSRSELEPVLRAVQADAIVASSALRAFGEELSSALGLPLFSLELDTERTAGAFVLSGGTPGAARLPGPAQTDDAAFINFTSGTTAGAKAAPSKHGVILDHLAAEGAFFGLTPADLGIHIVPLFYGGGTNASLIMPLLAGGSVVILPRPTMEAFYDAMREFRPTWYTAGFTFQQSILGAASRYPENIKRTKLRFIRSGSGRLPLNVLEGLERLFQCPVLERWGLIEAYGVVTANPPPPGKRKPGTVGIPIRHKVAILDDAGMPLSAGQEGEIVVFGPVVDGYVNESEVGKLSLRNGWLHTGDLGKFDEDGYLTLTGRIKEVINRGGEKISPVEIDSVLETHPAVAEAATFGVPHPTLGEVVIAAVVVKNGARLSEAEVKAQVRSHLSRIKVPRKVYFVDSLPRNSSGKVQRNDLATAIGLGETVHTELKGLDQDRYAAVARDLDGIAGPAASDHALPEKGLTIGSIIRSHAARTPDALAILAPGRAPLSFAGLANQMCYVQETLAGWGIMPGERVAGLISKGPEMATACATIPEAATFAPLDPDLSVDDYASLFARIRPRALIIESGSEHHVRVAAERMGIAQIELIADPSAPAGTFAMALSDATIPFQRTAPRLQGMAYILNTSGTTSRRKIVPIQHSQLIAGARAIKDWFEFRQTDLTLHLVPMYLGHGIMTSLMVPLLSGTSVVCPAEFDVDSFFMHLEEFKPTWYSAGFTVHRAILQRANDYQDIVARSRLRFIKSGSGRLSKMEIARLEELFDAPFLVPLSTTETHMIACNPLPPRVRKPDSVGLPVANQVKIIGEGDEFLGPGEQGEIVVCGPLVFSGYLDDDEANKRAFVDGWFRTGDLGWFDDDGYLYLSGRLKDIINRGGEKISPDEIDAVIEMHSAVAEAAAFGVPHPTLGEVVIAAVVVKNGARLSEDEVKVQVRCHLSQFKVPRKVYFVDSLPRDASGKMQRNDLAAAIGLSDVVHVEQQIEHKRADEGSRQLAPLEAALAGLWASTLGLEKVGVDDDFFLLGGDSLQAIRLIAEVHSVFGIEIGIEDVFSHASTVAGMAECIETVRRTDGDERTVSGSARGDSAPILPRDPSEPCPLSFAQQRLWILEQLFPNSPVYNILRVVRMTGALDVEALRRMLDAIVDRHEALRTTFAVVDGEPRQVVAPSSTVALPVVDLSGLPGEERDAEAHRLVTEDARRPFDLERGPLLRAELLKLGEEEHILVLTMHHIITDGWSSGIFNREMAALYEAFSTGKPSPLPDLPIQYADYAIWQRRTMQGEVLKSELAYWRRRLDGAPPVLELPTDRPRPAAPTSRGARQRRILPKPLNEALKVLSRQENATFYMLMLAAFNVLLHRYTGEDDIVVGAPIAGRTRVETEGLIGFFLNMLAMRTDHSGDPSFRELLGRVRETALGAYAHQDLPFDRLVEELRPERDVRHVPLIQVTLALLDPAGFTMVRPGWKRDFLDVDTETTKFDVSLLLLEVAEGLELCFEYDTDLFDAATIERMAGHFQVLLEGIVADPTRRISALPLLNDGERHRLLVEWNDTASAYPRQATIQGLFEEQADRAPDATAIVFEDTRLSYAELNARANQLAHHLQGLGVGPDTLVGICIERSVEMVVGTLAVLKAGGAYVPLDPEYPKARLEFMLADTAAPVLLTHAALRGQLLAFDGEIVDLDGDWDDIARQPANNPTSAVGPESLAYVIFTSGSTGRPKGTLIEHRGVVRLVKDTNYVSLGPDEVFLQLAPMSFDASTFELWGCLLNGATLAIMSPGVPSLEALAAALGRYRVSTLWLTGALFHLMVDEQLEALRGVRQILAGGEALSVSHVRRMIDALPDGHRLINGYGPTENTTFTACHVMTAGSEIGSSVPIGRPIANTRVYILDAHGQLVPVGLPGELYIGGDGLARAYLKQPDLTAEKFVADPFDDGPTERLYRTGDQCRWLVDGTIEFIGRRDQQVKLRGHRIELGEIETALAAHASVTETVVLLREDTPGDKRLVAYVVAGNDVTPEPSELRRFLQMTLPDYMTPAAFVILGELPLTPSGKIDREALPAPEMGAHTSQETYVAPRDELEAQLIEIWEQTLEVRPIGTRDNFFELGGHSLLSVRLFAELEKKLGQTLPLAILFYAPTVEQLADEIRKENWSGYWSSLVAIQPEGSRPPIFACALGDGNVLGYADLAKALGPEQPFYSLQSVGLDGQQPPLRSIEDIAAHNISEFQKIQPQGPYFLMGICIGGVVAFEMARQLEVQGEKVSLLALLQPSVLKRADERTVAKAVPESIMLLKFVYRRLLLYWRTFTELGRDERLAYLRAKGRMVWNMISQRDLFRGDRSEIYGIRVIEANTAALHSYVPKPYPGVASLFIASKQQSPSTRDRRLDWRDYVLHGLDIYEIPATDPERLIKEPHLRATVAALKACLRKARE